MMKRRRRINVLIVTLAALAVRDERSHQRSRALVLLPLTGCAPNGAGNIATFLLELALQATAAFLL